MVASFIKDTECSICHYEHIHARALVVVVVVFVVVVVVVIISYKLSAELIIVLHTEKDLSSQKG